MQDVERSRTLQSRIGGGIGLTLAGLVIVGRVLSAGATPAAAPTLTLPPSARPAVTAGVGATNGRTMTRVIADGSTEAVTVYRSFSATELRRAGLAETAYAGGTLWVGADRNDFRSIYFLSPSGVGVRVADSSPAGRARSVQSLAITAAHAASAS